MADSDLTAQQSPIARRYGKAGEASWSHVLNHFALSEGFALVVLVVPDQDASNICCQELSQWLGERGKQLLDLSPPDPGTLRDVASTLLSQPATPDLGCVWLGAATTENDADHFIWRDAWRWGLGTLNQHRNSLREHFDCTVVVAGPPWLLPLFREVAPDLWSIRSIVAWLDTDVDVSTPTFPLDGERWDDPLRLIGGRPAGDLNLALREADRLRGVPGQERLLAEMLLRVGQAYGEAGLYAQAESSFREGHDFFKRFDDKSAMLRGLVLLASVIGFQDRSQEAEMLLRQALLEVERGDYQPTARVVVKGMMAKALVDQNRFAEAEILFRDFLSNELNSDADTVRAIVIQWFAEMMENQGRYTEAEGLFRQALAIKEIREEDILSRAVVIGRLGVLMAKQRKYEDAEVLFRQQLKLREEGKDSVHSRVGAMVALGAVLAGQGRLNDAYQIVVQTQALLDEPGETLHSTEHSRQVVKGLQQLLANIQRLIAETNTNVAPITP